TRTRAAPFLASFTAASTSESRVFQNVGSVAWASANRGVRARPPIAARASRRLKVMVHLALSVLLRRGDARRLTSRMKDSSSSLVILVVLICVVGGGAAFY